MRLSNRGAADFQRLAVKTLGLFKPPLLLHHTREVVEAHGIGRMRLSNGGAGHLKRLAVKTLGLVIFTQVSQAICKLRERHSMIF